MIATGELEFVSGLYRKYTSDLAAVVEQQRTFLATNASTVTPQLDDLEAEITYLLLREYRPEHVVEIGTFYGWSTTWLLSALRDNGTGHLHSFDMVDHVKRTVPSELSDGRWTFTKGDVKENLDALPADTDYLFIDADHGKKFGQWYVDNLFPRMTSGIPASVHDVFHGRSARVWSEGQVVVKWLADHDVPFFTAARKNSPKNFDAINEVRTELGLTGARGSTKNPMIWFNLP
ncbi:methyltransferase family protein [Pseudonocardia sediminis]|uniref:Methyltransferase family protein n=1 Tax=Pseudonocardia sediminis TaxID=1397368 RepID=A0A4Q7V8E3_PSEST|nr:class I SAM-dependent methyltransferase [Pseudonocardia sediminis]RZT89069.1 methyltransferase family protein [Pseudonocardia sediminis]